MKRNFLFAIGILLVTIVSAQKKSSNIGDAKWSIGINMDALDAFSPKLGEFSTFKRGVDFGPKVTAWYNPNSSIAIDIHAGSQSIRRHSDTLDNNLHWLQSGLGLVYKLNNGYILKETTPVAPYIFVHGNVIYADVANTSDKQWGFGLPIGLGINFRLANDIALNVHGGYSWGLTKLMEDNIFYSAGLMFDIRGKKNKVKIEKVVEEIIPEAVVEADTDGDGVADAKDDCPKIKGLVNLNGCPDADDDGIADSKDDCPSVAGLARFDGCPDTDGDGIVDSKDDCPNKKGISRLKGCPLTDVDGDGIEDAKDKCPSIPGIAKLNGCPDADGDGITDAEDRCPTIGGVAANKGCPEVKEEVKEKLARIAKNIQFETGSAVIKTSSFKILDEIVTIMNDYPAYSSSIEGHTDNVGNEDGNLKLSEKRAAAAAAYLVNKGITVNRVRSIGYGETRPIADNTTSVGRSTNRRVTFELFVP